MSPTTPPQVPPRWVRDEAWERGMTHRHIPTSHAPRIGQPERCRFCAAVIRVTEEAEPQEQPGYCDLCLSGIPHMCPATGEFRVLLGGQRL